MSIRNVFLFHQLVFRKFQAAAVGVVGQREIPDAVQIGFTSQGILAQLHVGISQEHAGPASAPKERLLGRIDKGIDGLLPFFLLVIDETDAELCPLALHIVLEPAMGKFLETHDGTVVLFVLLVFKAFYPEVVGVFLAELACVLQQGIGGLDFFGVFLGVVAVQFQDRLHPQRLSLHRIQQEAELGNRLVFALQTTKRNSPFFPQGHASIYVQSAGRQKLLQGIFRRCHRSRRILRKGDRIHNGDGIQQNKASGRLVLGAGHPGVGNLFGQTFRSALDLTQALNRLEGGILVSRRTGQQLDIKFLGLGRLLELFQIQGVAVLESGSVFALGILFQEHLQGIRMGRIGKAGVRHGGFDTHTGGGLVKIGILGVLVPESKGSAHLGVIPPHKTGAGHSQNNALF